MYFRTQLVFFFTSICTCYTQPYPEALNSVAAKIFPPGQLQRDHFSSIPNTSFHIPNKRTGNIVKQKNSEFQTLTAYEPSDQFPSKTETPSPKWKAMYIPFTYNHTPRTKEFIASTTKEFYARLTEKKQMELLSVLSHYIAKKKNIHETCYLEKISEVYYRVSRSGYEECCAICSRQNVSYVKFLNKIVRRLSEHLFSGKLYVKLYPIFTDVCPCVHSEEEGKYYCECKLNYQIVIHRDLYKNALNILNGENHNYGDIKSIDYFVTVLFFLKFLPRTAPLYVAFVFYIQKLRWTKIDRLKTYPDIQFVDPYSHGKVEETNLFPNVYDKLFEKIVEVIKFEEPDINIFIDAFHNLN